MDTYRDEYTINPETGRKIKIGTQTWKRLATKCYMIDRKFTDQLVSDSRAYVLNKVLEIKAANKPKHTTLRKREGNSKGERKYLIVRSKAWNERYLEYEWNGHKFGEKRSRPLPEFMNTVEKRHQTH